jgi:hypothetical protein
MGALCNWRMCLILDGGFEKGWVALEPFGSRFGKAERGQRKQLRAALLLVGAPLFCNTRQNTCLQPKPNRL